MMVAPQGREGTYSALASAPLFTAKLFVGGLSGTSVPYTQWGSPGPLSRSSDFGNAAAPPESESMSNILIA